MYVHYNAIPYNLTDYTEDIDTEAVPYYGISIITASIVIYEFCLAL